MQLVAHQKNKGDCVTTALLFCSNKQHALVQAGFVGQCQTELLSMACIYACDAAYAYAGMTALHCILPIFYIEHLGSALSKLYPTSFACQACVQQKTSWYLLSVAGKHKQYCSGHTSF